MRVVLPVLLVLSPGLIPAGASAWEEPGRLVSVSVEIDGRPAPLYPDPRGTGRFYLEAREGGRYAVRLANRTGERLGVVLTVDGLNAISGEQDPGPARPEWSRPGRMYVLSPWDRATIRGWRTSLEDVRRFTFVDERASYAARSGKANARMGWIEVAVYRERAVVRPWEEGGARLRRDREEGTREQPPAAPSPDDRLEPGAAKDVPRPSAAPEGQAGGERQQESLEALGSARKVAPRSYPGTGWGPRAHDPVVVVEFEPEPRPAESVTLRYEYAPALRALGVLPPAWPDRGRLGERERGERGFAAPPEW